MAKAHTIDDVIDNIVKNYSNLLKDAVEHVAKQAEKDIYNKAINVLYKYYYGAYEPKSYDRIFALQHSIASFSNVSTKGSGRNEKIRCVVGVVYDSELLEAYLSTIDDSAYETSKNKLGHPRKPISEWVVGNFWEGLHPYTDGSSEPGAKVKYRKSPLTQEQGMYQSDDTGPSLARYQFTIFPQLVREYMLRQGVKLS